MSLDLPLRQTLLIACYTSNIGYFTPIMTHTTIVY